jgi:cobaltochelatase CobT
MVQPESLIKTAKTLALNNNLDINIQAEKKDIAIIRGIADYQAFWDKYHSKEIQIKLYLQYPITHSNDARNILDKCEWARIQSIGCLKYLGVRTNLNKALDTYCLNQGYSFVKDPFSINIDDLISIYLRSLMSSVDLPLYLTELYKNLPLEFKKTISNYLDNLRNSLFNQEEYGLLCVKLIQDLKVAIEPNNFKNEVNTTQETADEGDRLSDTKNEIIEVDSTSKEIKEISSEPGIMGLSAKVQKYKIINLQPIDDKLPYKIFTTEFDEVIQARKLVTIQESENLKQIFVRKTKPFLNEAITHSKAFARLLQGKRRVSWRYEQESGIVDSRHFARFITGNSRGLFKEYELATANDTAISLLVDNSGSMRGKHIVIAALCAKLLMNLLEKFQIKCEVLGFTTADWRGGQSYKKWHAAGGPANPGRLNDLRHIIFKSFNESLIKAQTSLNIMLKESLLKENIDGEALEWAYRRIIRQPKHRKILMIISDGAPVDDMTLKHNRRDLLEEHLKDVVKSIEKGKQTELVAIGIGHDVSKFYENAIRISDSDNLSHELFNNLIESFSKKKLKTQLNNKYSKL